MRFEDEQVSGDLEPATLGEIAYTSFVIKEALIAVLSRRKSKSFVLTQLEYDRVLEHFLIVKPEEKGISFRLVPPVEGLPRDAIVHLEPDEEPT